MRATICACQRCGLVAVAQWHCHVLRLRACAAVPLRARGAPFRRRPSWPRRPPRPSSFPAAFLSAAAFSAAAFSAAAFGRRPAFSASSRSASFFSARASCCSLFLLLSFSCARRSSSCLRSTSAGSGLGGPCSSRRRLGFGFGAGSGGGGSGFGSRCDSLQRRSSTTVASMASVVTGGGRCFQVNQPYTAAATIPECSSTDSAIARQRPCVTRLLPLRHHRAQRAASFPAAA